MTDVSGLHPSIHRFVLASAAVLATAGCATTPGPPPIDLGEATARLGRYTPERRRELYREVDGVANAVLRTGKQAVVRPVRTATVPGGEGQRVELATARADGVPDRFMLASATRRDTQDFGYLFDLDRDGRVDWLVFNGGPFIAKGGIFFWMNYHLVDTNGDGRFDLFVYNDLDLDGDRAADPGVTAWIFDRDFDGIPDEAEYVTAEGTKPVPREGDELVVAVAMGTARIATRADFKFFGWWNGILAAVNGRGE